MKTNFKYVTLIAAALVLGLGSCSNDEAVVDKPDNGPTKSVLIKIATGAPSTYADEASMNGSTPIDDHYGANVYFLNGTLITDHFPIIAVGRTGGVTVDDLIAGYTFSSVSGNADKVYIVVNRPENVTLPASGQLSDIEKVAFDIESFKNIKTVTMKGAGDIDKDATSVTVTVAPVVARFEIGKVEYDASATSSMENLITSYTLDGIFVNNYHKTMGLDFLPIAGELYSSVLPAAYIKDNFPDPVSDIFTDKTGVTAYTPEKEVWAYQFFPVDQANSANDQPMLVIRLSEVVETASIPQFGVDQFISVNKFKNIENGTYITQFEPNHIYKIANIKFSNRNLSTQPGIVLKDIEVEVKVDDWEDVEITPDL